MLLDYIRLEKRGVDLLKKHGIQSYEYELKQLENQVERRTTVY